MPRSLSLSARRAFNAAATDAVLVTLATIRHDSLVAPIRLSSDPTVRLSVDPLRYGTVHLGNEYEFVLMAAGFPDDSEGSPPASQITFENVTQDMASPFRAITSPMSVDLTMVLSGTPDVIEEQYIDLRGLRASYDANTVSLDISREIITSEPWPAQRMTQARFPGLYR